MVPFARRENPLKRSEGTSAAVLRAFVLHTFVGELTCAASCECCQTQPGNSLRHARKRSFIESKGFPKHRGNRELGATFLIARWNFFFGQIIQQQPRIGFLPTFSELTYQLLFNPEFRITPYILSPRHHLCDLQAPFSVAQVSHCPRCSTAVADVDEPSLPQQYLGGAFAWNYDLPLDFL